MNPKIVSVVNNYEVYDKVVKNNQNLSECEIFDYDNRQDNVSITKRYNDFISEQVYKRADEACGLANSENRPEDFWIFFIHQDFGIQENIQNIVQKLDSRFIYGAVGAKFYRGIYFNRRGFKRFHVVNYGKILQGENDFNFHEYGLAVNKTKTVDSVDCCCIIIHSSLIKKHKILFDENLGFHMYAEELCYSAKKNHKIKTKVVQMDCFHMGMGVLNAEFEKSAQYLKEKFNIKRVPSTCPN